MPGKIGKNLTVIDDVTGPVEATVDLSEHEDYAVQVNYGAGGLVSDDILLQASLDGVNFSPIAASVQAMDPAGGSHIMNVTDSHYKFVKIVVEGASVNTSAIFIGERNWD